MAVRYFFDTYAFYEFINKNERYKKYFKNYEIVTTRLNLIELFYILLKDLGLEFARKCYYTFLPFTIEFEDEIVEESMLFKLKNIKRNLSYIDSIGYILALKKGLKFLTGDKEFRGMKGVEFVK